MNLNDEKFEENDEPFSKDRFMHKNIIIYI